MMKPPNLSALLTVLLWVKPCSGQAAETVLSDRYGPLLGHLMNSLSGGRVTVVLDDTGMQLMQAEAFNTAPTTKYNINDSPSVKQFEGNNFLSETVMFLLLGTEGGHFVKQVEKFFNIKACYVFIFPRQELDLATVLSSKTSLQKVRKIMFAWPAEEEGNARFQIYNPSPPIERMARPVPKLSTVWPPLKTGKGRSELLFPPVHTDLGGRTIRITTFNFPPLMKATMKDDNSMTMTGFEASMMNTLSRALNFVPHYQQPSDKKSFGFFIEKNKTFVGLFGDLQHGRTDIGMANLWIRTDTFAYFDFSVPYNYDGLCFLIPLPEETTDYLALLRPMSLATWMWLLGSTGLVSILLVQSERVFGRSWAGGSAGRGVLFVVGSILKEPYPFRPRLLSLRIMLGTFILSSSVVIYGYSGTLTSFLTISLPPEQLEKVSDLVTLDAAPSARQNSINMTKQFLRDPNPAYRPLAKKFHFFPSLGVGIEWVKEGKIVMIGSRFRLEYYGREFLLENDGQPGSYILNECWQSLYSVGWGLQKNSPLNEPIQEKAGFLRDVGLTEKWLRDSLDNYGSNDLRLEKSVTSEKLKISDMTVAFLTWPICLIPCLLAIALELALGAGATTGRAGTKWMDPPSPGSVMKKVLH